jgi:hypothetical protein
VALWGWGAGPAQHCVCSRRRALVEGSVSRGPELASHAPPGKAAEGAGANRRCRVAAGGAIDVRHCWKRPTFFRTGSISLLCGNGLLQIGLQICCWRRSSGRHACRSSWLAINFSLYPLTQTGTPCITTQFCMPAVSSFAAMPPYTDHRAVSCAELGASDQCTEPCPHVDSHGEPHVPRTIRPRRQE